MSNTKFFSSEMSFGRSVSVDSAHNIIDFDHHHRIIMTTELIRNFIDLLGLSAVGKIVAYVSVSVVRGLEKRVFKTGNIIVIMKTHFYVFSFSSTAEQ